MNWKGELLQHLTFVGLPLAGVLGVWAALRAAAVDRLGATAFRRLAVALFLLTRVGVPLVVFGAFGYEGSGDLRGQGWLQIAEAVLAGRDPAPFIVSPYGPLYPWVLAAGWWITGSIHPPTMALPFVVADALALLVVLRMARRHLPERLARRTLLALLACPLLWHAGTILTQDEPLFAFFLVWTIDLADRDRPAAAVGVAVLGTLLTKILFPLFAIPALLAPRDSWGRAVTRVGAMFVLIAAGTGLTMLLGMDLSTRFGAGYMAGSTTWHLFTDSVDAVGYRAGILVTGAVCMLLTLVARRHRDGESTVDRAARGTVAVQYAFFVICPFTIPLHLTHALPLLVWQVVREGAAARRRPAAPVALAAGLCAWQIPALAIDAQQWKEWPLLIPAFAVFCAWACWRALAVPWRDPAAASLAEA